MDEDSLMVYPKPLQLIVISIIAFVLSACVDSADLPNPTAFDDEFSVATESTGTLLDVLANDQCDCSLSIVSVDGPDDAGSSTTTISGNRIEFTPDPALRNGDQATFTYVVENADGDSAIAEVTVTMLGDTFPKPADDAFSVSTGSSNNAFDVLSNDECDCTLTLVAVTDPDDAGASTTTINNEQIEYTPDPALGGGATETFSYTVENDEGDQVSATVTVTLVAGPVANSDTLAISKNSPHNAIDVLGNDSVSIGNKSIDSFDTTSANGGRVWLHSDGLQLVYQPPLNSLEDDSFEYTLTDGLATSTATVTVSATDHVAGVRPCESEAADRLAAGRPYCFDVLVPAATPDGHTIGATVFVPADGGSSKPPVLMHAHGFGESRFAELENPNAFMVNRVTAQSLLELWHEGYWVVSYDQRGFNASNLWGPTANSSNGQCQQAGDAECIDVLNPEREGRDMVAMVDWVIENLREGYVATLDPNAQGPALTFDSPPAGAAALYDDSDGDVMLGTMGLSYGGGFQTIGSGVSQALNGFSRINAMIPVTTWFDIRYSLAPNDVPKSGWIQFLTAATQTGGTTLAANGFLAGVGQEALVEDNVSSESYDSLYLRSPRVYCEGLGDSAIGDTPDNTLQPSFGDSSTPLIPAVFIIQGQRDLLFNYNEALDLAECYEAAGSPDVRLLIQTEGHILPAAQASSYKGESEVIYIDEEIYCDAAGANKILTRELMSSWFRDNLGAPVVAEAFRGTNQSPPKVCTTHFLTGDAPVSGSTFNSFAEVPVGDISGAGNNTFDILDNGNPVSITLPGGGTEQPLYQQTLITASGDVLISGIPLLNLSVSGTGSPSPADDARFFAKLGVIRADNTAVEIVADQETPISGSAPTASPDCLDPAGGCPVSFTYPDVNRHYPDQVGEGSGAIAGISVKLSAGDALVLQFFDQSSLYNLHGTNPGRYTLTIDSGTVQIPVVP